MTTPDRSGELDRKFRAGASLETAKYRFAKTMTDNPHWYTVGDTWVEPALHKETCETINEFGVDTYFASKKSKRGSFYPQLALNGYTYWTMWPKQSTLDTLINRKRAYYQVGYDEVAQVYDQTFSPSDPIIAQENQVVTDMLKPYLVDGAEVFDIGCGSGLFVDLFADCVPPERYTGIDPSVGMVIEFAAKHPAWRHRLRLCPLEDAFPSRRFDLVVSTFTSFAVDAEHIRRMLKPGGRGIFIVPGPDTDMADWLGGLPIVDAKHNIEGGAMIGAIGNRHVVYEIT